MQLLKVLILISLAGISSPTLAARSSGGACKNLAKACQAGGYTKGNSKKRIGRDCLRPLLKGQTVAGVTVSPADLSTCKKDRAGHRGH